MTVAWLHRALLPLVTMLWLATLSPSGPPTPHHASLAGDLLIASPGIVDPRFRHTVILIVKDDAGGALGVVINRPVGTVPLASLLAAIGQNGSGVIGNVRIFDGGPVAPHTGFIVHSADYRRAGTVAIDGRVAMTLSADILLDIGHGRGPAKYLVAFGCAGWSPGQLAAELMRGDWFVTREDAELVFDEDRARVWNDAIARQAMPP